MAFGRQVPPASEGRPIQAPRMMRHGPFPGAGHHSFDPLEHKIALQVEEIERLSRENHRLASTHGALRQDLVAAQQELQGLDAHIGSIKTESDIQIRVLLEKIAKMEADIRSGEAIKNDLQQAHKDAQSLVASRQELATQIREAAEELQIAQAEVKQLPELHDELNRLGQEHHRLRAAFEKERDLNMEKVEQMKAMEKNLVAMAREVEKLRAEVLIAEKRAHAPSTYGSTYGKPDSSYPPPILGSGTHVDGYGKPYGQMGVGAAGNGVNLYGGSTGAGAVSGGVAVATSAGAVTNSGGWGGSYDAIRTSHSSLSQGYR